MTDAMELAQRLRFGPHELVDVLGGPWSIALRIPERESEQPGTLFVGRAGPTVGILVGDAVDPEVTVGQAVALWVDASTVQWTLTDPEAVLQVPPAGAPSRDVDAALDALGRAVEAAYEASGGRLLICRYCARVVATIRAVGPDCCVDCSVQGFGA